MTRKFLSALSVLMLSALPALAEPAPETPAGYVRTGESKTCLRTMNIDSMRIINADQILVKMNNGDTWLQQPRSCSKLRKYYTFVYDTVGGELCDTTGVTLHSSAADFAFAGVCIFDKFEKLEKQAAEAN